MGGAQHREPGMTERVEIEILDACFAQLQALISKRTAADEAAVRLCADEIERLARGIEGFLQGYDFPDVAALVVFGWNEVVVVVVVAVEHFVLALPLAPVPQLLADQLGVKGKRAVTALGLCIAEIIEAMTRVHRKPLNLVRDRERVRLHIA